MADGAYERRGQREAELKRLERVLRELSMSRKVVADSNKGLGRRLKNEVDESLTIV